MNTLTKLVRQAEAASGDRNIVRFTGPDNAVRFKVYPTGSSRPLQDCRVGEVIGTWQRRTRSWVNDAILRSLLCTHFFGCAAGDNYFQVDIPTNPDAPVLISHFFEWAGSAGEPNDAQRRVGLSRARWDAIAETVERVFNAALIRQAGKSPGRPLQGQWQPGHNILSWEFGKELTLLAWAIEDADQSDIPAALANWQGLETPERWWLYTQTNAATGHWLRGRNKGWRKAVRFALTENPTSV